MCRYGMSTYKHHYVCLSCRWSAKREWPSSAEHRCPLCRAGMIDAGLDLAIPPKRDDSGWAALAAVLRAGLTFHSCGCGGPGYRPRSSAEVRERRAVAERLGITERSALGRVDP